MMNLEPDLRDRDRLRLILIAGPSSSGQTTFCYRLATQRGCWPVTVTLSTDDYFCQPEETPRRTPTAHMILSRCGPST